METVTFSIPREYGYVLISTVASYFVATWHGARVGGFRSRAQIPYPQCYADNADFDAAKDNAEKKKALYLFNCAQRAHANFLENYTAVVTASLVAGIRQPIATAILTGGWLVGRCIYAWGYTRPNMEKGKGRLFGSPLIYICQLGLWGMLGWTGIKMVM